MKIFKTFFVRNAPLLLLLFEAVNLVVIAWVVGPVPWGLLLGLVFAILGSAGVRITPGSPKWFMPAWVVVSLLINGALWGRAAWNLAVMFFVLVDPMIPWALATAGFGLVHLWLVNKAREVGPGPPPSSK